MSRLILLLLLVSVAIADEAQAPFTLDRLRDISVKIATVRVPFTQIKRLALLDEPITSQGVIEISRPLAAVRWEFTGKSTLIFTNGKVRRWGARGDEETAEKTDPNMNAMAEQMRALLTGDMQAMNTLFIVTPDPGGAPALILVPREPGIARYIVRLELRFRDDLSAPRSLRLIAPGDDLTDYAFGEPELGVDLPKARFEKP